MLTGLRPSSCCVERKKPIAVRWPASVSRLRSGALPDGREGTRPPCLPAMGAVPSFGPRVIRRKCITPTYLPSCPRVYQTQCPFTWEEKIPVRSNENKFHGYSSPLFRLLLAGAQGSGTPGRRARLPPSPPFSLRSFSVASVETSVTDISPGHLHPPHQNTPPLSVPSCGIVRLHYNKGDNDRSQGSGAPK